MKICSIHGIDYNPHCIKCSYLEYGKGGEQMSDKKIIVWGLLVGIVVAILFWLVVPVFATNYKEGGNSYQTYNGS